MQTNKQGTNKMSAQNKSWQQGHNSSMKQLKPETANDMQKITALDTYYSVAFAIFKALTNVIKNSTKYSYCKFK
jgi:hypothetical protein